MARWVALLLLWMMLAVPAAAGEPALSGRFEQGGLVLGSGAAGADLRLDGRRLRVDDRGYFIFGFTRDAKPVARLTAAWPDGRRWRRDLEIARRQYKIQRIDGLPPKMVTPPQAVIDRIRRENKAIKKARMHDSPVALFRGGWQWPAIGVITGVYGSQRILNGQPRRPHFGIDIAAPTGTPVRAPADAIVRLAKRDLYFTGGTLVLDHGHGLSSALLHMARLDVAVGQKVTRGQVIGTVGSTGRSTGPHLDWRINWFGERLDPAQLVGPMPPAK